MSEHDPFDVIHRLLQRRRFAEVLRRLVFSDRNAIRPPYDSDLNHAWYIVGSVHYKRRRFKQSVDAALRAVKSWPGDKQAHLMLGNAHSMIADHRSAERAFRKALRIDPNSKEIAYNLGNALYDQDKFAEAIKVYEKVRRSRSKIGEMARKNLKLTREKIKERK